MRDNVCKIMYHGISQVAILLSALRARHTVTEEGSMQSVFHKMDNGRESSAWEIKVSAGMGTS